MWTAPFEEDASGWAALSLPWDAGYRTLRAQRHEIPDVASDQCACRMRATPALYVSYASRTSGLSDISATGTSHQPSYPGTSSAVSVSVTMTTGPEMPRVASSA